MNSFGTRQAAEERVLKILGKRTLTRNFGSAFAVGREATRMCIESEVFIMFHRVASHGIMH